MYPRVSVFHRPLLTVQIDKFVEHDGRRVRLLLDAARNIALRITHYFSLYNNSFFSRISPEGADYFRDFERATRCGDWYRATKIDKRVCTSLVAIGYRARGRLSIKQIRFWVHVFTVKLTFYRINFAHTFASLFVIFPSLFFYIAFFSSKTRIAFYYFLRRKYRDGRKLLGCRKPQNYPHIWRRKELIAGRWTENSDRKSCYRKVNKISCQMRRIRVYSDIHKLPADSATKQRDFIAVARATIRKFIILKHVFARLIK